MRNKVIVVTFVLVTLALVAAALMKSPLPKYQKEAEFVLDISCTEDGATMHFAGWLKPARYFLLETAMPSGDVYYYVLRYGTEPGSNSEEFYKNTGVMYLRYFEKIEFDEWRAMMLETPIADDARMRTVCKVNVDKTGLGF